MAKLTITEALAEIKLVEKKIEHKTQFVLANLTRFRHQPDPLKDGPATIKAEMQSIGDLRQRIVDLRSAISKANNEQRIEIGNQSKTIQEWLTWKRECSKHEIDLYNAIHKEVAKKLADNAARPQLYKDKDEDKPRLAEIETNVNYPEYVEKAQASQETLDKLDGQLSLKNATVLIVV